MSGFKPGTAWNYHCSKHRESELKDVPGYVTDEILNNERPVFVKL